MSSKERRSFSTELVIPGDPIRSDGLRPGFGTYEVNGNIYSAHLGVVKRNERAGFVNVLPLKGKYHAKNYDKVIGTIMDMGPSYWTVDIGAPYPASLHVNEVLPKIEYGETSQFLTVGDSILSQVNSIDHTRRIHLTLRHQGLRRLRGGRLVKVNHNMVPRIIGRGGYMINMLKETSETRIFVGQNGFVWIDGDNENISKVIEAIRYIENASDRATMDQRVRAILEEF